MYFLIECDENRNVSITHNTEERILKIIEDLNFECFFDGDGLDGMQLNWHNYEGKVHGWENRVLIIKGEIVVPKNKKVLGKEDFGI